MSEVMWSRKRISRRKFLGVAAASAGVTMLGGCGGSGGGGGTSGGGQGYRIALIQGVSGDEFYVTMACGARQAAQNLGADLQVQGPQEFAAPPQTEILNAVVQASPDAILIAPTDETAMIQPIRSAIDQDIAVFTVDTSIREDIALANISSGNVEGGRRAGDAMAKRIGEQGKVFSISVAPGVSTTDQRVQGFQEAIETYPDIEYLGTEYCDNSPSEAASIAQATLQSNPELKGVFGANLFSGQGAATGVQQMDAQEQVAVVAFDAAPDQVEELREERLDTLIAQHPNVIGQKGVQMAVEYLNTGEPPNNDTVTTAFTVVTRENLEQQDVQKYLYVAEC